MTIEERVDSICKWQNGGLRDLVIQEMRALVEEAAKICDEMCEQGTISIEEAERRGHPRHRTTASAAAAHELARQIRALTK